MSSDLKPGDRALVLKCLACPELVGRIGVVVGARGGLWYDRDTDRYVRGVGYCLDISPPMIGHKLQHLIRIPPDSEMRQMFRETERPREVANG